MKFVSTRGKSPACLVSDAIQQGLAPDGGLFVPESWPPLEISPGWSQLKFSEFATKVLTPFFTVDPLESKLGEICKQAFNFPVPLEKLDDTTSVVELFHGPTNAFKDFGARFLALCIDALPAPSAKERMVLVATSGDTGGAVAAAFHDCTKIAVSILYPKGLISPRQEKQLTVWGNRVKAFAVDGSFDDCQKMVKSAFLSEKWQQKFQLISANSINVGRLLPQMAYMAYTGLRYQQLRQHLPGFIVPSGNIGNSAAVLWARRMGFPIGPVIFAHNANTTVPNYFQTGVWSPQTSISTLANAMDVGAPSNFERVLHLFPKPAELKKLVSAYSVSDEQIRLTIIDGFQKWGKIYCPHTATAMALREMQRAKDENQHWIVVATAHPAKFETIVEPLIKQKIEIPANLEAVLNKPSASEDISSDLQSLESKIFVTKS